MPATDSKDSKILAVLITIIIYSSQPHSLLSLL